MVSPAATKPAAVRRSDDWRILAILGPYRLLLIAALLFLFRFNLAPDYFQAVSTQLLFFSCFAYAALALTLQFLALNQRFSLTAQALLHFAVDLTALGLLVYTTGGVGGGLGILLVPPLVGCSLVLTPRLSLVFAAAATLTIFGQETLRQLRIGQIDSSSYSQAGLLGLMFFATCLTAAMVGLRARRSEAVAARVGSEFINLTRLNDNIIAAMQAGVLVVDADARVRTANAAALRLTADQVNVDAQLDVVLPALHDALLAWRQGAVVGAASGAIVGPAGRELLPRFTRLGWGEQAPTLIMLEDAGALRMQAQQMKLAALGRLSANIAHEIRNPLSAITQAGQLLAEHPELDAGNRRLLDMIQRHAVRIDHIVRSVLDISRRKPTRREPLILRDHLRRSAAMYHESHARGPRTIELADVPSSVTVLFDPEHLQQVLFNLWDNSFEHGGEHSHAITVLLQAGVQSDSGLPWLELRDNGIGLPVEVVERLFEPFFTTHATGTGLGLYLSRELCEYNQARLSHVSTATGTCFRIVFQAPSSS